MDRPGTWHHVLNRGIAKRPYFETRSDKRYFLSRLAHEVRAGRLEVHAFCLMTTHFHLLVRSPMGELSEAMRRVQNAYSRFFNRRRRRDGPLIRARFFSKRVDTTRYRMAVLRYIDHNPVRARIVSVAAEHEFGSARSFVVGPRPRWLSVDWIEERARELTGEAAIDGSVYLRAFGPRDRAEGEATAELVEARMASSSELDPLDDLLGHTPEQVRDWMARKARLADGMEVGLPVCGPTSVTAAVERSLAEGGEWVFEYEGRLLRGSELAHVGLLRDLCSMPFAGIGRRLGLGVWKATRRVDLHHELLEFDEAYGARLSRIAHRAMGGAEEG